MKTLFLTLLCALAAVAMAGDQITITSTVTNQPSHGDTWVINSDTRTWNTNATAITQIQIGDTLAESGSNLWTHVANNPFTGRINASQVSGGVRLLGLPDQGMVGSLTGSWGLLAVVTNASTSGLPVIVPFDQVSAAAASNLASQVVGGINSYSGTAISPSKIDGTSFTITNVFGGVTNVLYFGNGVLTNATQL